MIALALVAAAACYAAQSFSGIDLVERTEGLMVWRVRPGPLDGDILSSASLFRGDLITSIDGKPATLSAWNAAHLQAAGTLLTLDYREGSPRGWRGAPNAAGTEQSVAVALDDAAVWSGSINSGDLAPLDPALLSAASASSEIPRALEALGPVARARSTALLNALGVIPDGLRDPTTSTLMRAIFKDPSRAESLVTRAIPSAADWTSAPFRAAAQLVSNLDPDASRVLSASHGTFEVPHSEAGIWYLDFLLNEARVRHSEQVKHDAAFASGLRALVTDRLDNLLVRGPHARDSMQALRGVSSLAPGEAAGILAHFDVTLSVAKDLATSEVVALPDELKGAVEGTIIAVSRVDELGWLVVGGAGANTYDLSRVAAVFDVAGDDQYRWNSTAGAHRLIVDLAGNDRHTSIESTDPASPSAGPCAALGCVSVIDDHGGNDRYEGGDLTVAAALGVALLLDRGGDDFYSGGAWSLGAATGGCALLIDLAGNDTYAGKGMSLGVGGPSGVGAVIDLAGDDRATLGTNPSVYGVEGEHAGFGMGFGVGYRFAAAGGVGAYIDFAGNDTRSSGEFSQGCGYYLGLGILFDAAGNDTTLADRYGIGSAAHQAIGIAIDQNGDDSYRGKTAAHLGGAWDESIAIFSDKLGNDSYEVASLSLGAAAQQAVGIMSDHAGTDTYRAASTFLGAASTNDYHFAATGLGSLALFFDLAGLDIYPDTRTNNSRTMSSETPTAELASLDSVFIDEEPSSATGVAEKMKDTAHFPPASSILPK